MSSIKNEEPVLITIKKDFMKIGYYIVASAIILGKTYCHSFKKVASCDEIAIRDVKVKYEKWLRKHYNDDVDNAENFEVLAEIKERKYI